MLAMSSEHTSFKQIRLTNPQRLIKQHQAEHKHHNNHTIQMQIFIRDFVAAKSKETANKKCDEVFK